jgi:hypothetical protein
MNDRMIRTNNKTGKNDLEYSTSIRRAIDPEPSAAVRLHTNLSTATTTPDKSVKTESINAKLMLKRTSAR